MAVMAYTTRVVVLWTGWCVEEDTAQTIGAFVTGIVAPAVAIPVMIRAVNWWVKRTDKD
jgi:murein endopeptidase